MREQFIDKNFRGATLDVIETANDIIAEYTAAGYTLTIRQLYYQFVSRDLLPNNQRSYDRLGSIISDGRLAGLIDWSAIEDRLRRLESHASWTDPASIIGSAAASYAIDRWSDQPHRVEVWIEKDALTGILERVCDDWQVPYFACRGYNSQSAQYEAGKRFARYLGDGQQPVVLHLGDHDPSGIDMTRDNRDRLGMFAEARVQVERLALNMDQVNEYNPPPNPAKLTDSRAIEYIELHGPDSWELDALDPKVIDELIRDAIGHYVDHDLWGTAVARETTERQGLTAAADDWAAVQEFLANRY